MDTKPFMKNFFETYYKKLLAEYDGAVTLPDVPEEMWADGADPKAEWKRWKLIPANICDEDIALLEKELGLVLPKVVKDFLTTYYHLFDDPIGRNPVDEPFEGLKNAWNPLLVRAGYLPFAWDKNAAYIRCIDLENMPDEAHCPIYEIDHEILFEFDQDAENARDEIKTEMKPVADSFTEYLKALLEDKE